MAFEYVDFRVVNLRVDMVVHRSVLGSQVFGTDKYFVNNVGMVMRRQDVQCRRTLHTKLAMENKNRLPRVITAYRWTRFQQAGSKE